MSSLVAEVRGLVEDARTAYAGTPAAGELAAVASRLSAPLRVAIAGRVKAGKSTLLNALVGQPLAATDAGECTRVVSWYVDGVDYRVTLHPRGGPPRQLPFRQRDGSLDIDLGPLAPSDVDRLVITWPSPALRAMTLVDTPGMGSAHAEVGARTQALLAPTTGSAAEVDAVIYLMRHVHGEDANFLEAFRDGSLDRHPINTIAVLARADEVGHAQPDALDTAGRIAARYLTDPRVRALCHTVVPVAGLLAAAAAALTEADYRALTELAADPRADWLLAGADRLTQPDPDPPARDKAELLDRLGMFGLRLAVHLIRSGRVRGAAELAGELVDASGLPRLRALLHAQFAARADVLKSRAALSAVESLLHRHPLPAARALLHELERIRSGAHEFAEIALLDRIRDNAIALTTSETADAERLLGTDGTGIAARLGLPAQAGRDELARTAARQHQRWQQRVESPGSSRDVAEAARVLVRTCEGLLTTIGRTS